MADLIREAPVGQIIRYLTRNRVFQYPEERPDFALPSQYASALHEKNSRHTSSVPTPADQEKPDKLDGDQRDADYLSAVSLHRTKSREQTEPFSEERLEVDAELAIERTKSIPIAPQKTADGNILVDWYTTDDPANPQNWSNKRRGFVTLQVCLYTFAVYSGSAIYTSSEQSLLKVFGINIQEASLPLSLYVLAYGMGPLLWAPLSELPSIGRNPVYIGTFTLFVILSVPTALVKNFGGLLALRFLQGFFGSPCLANGGATMQDMYSLLNLPFFLSTWVSAAYCGPALGPLLSGFAVPVKGWRWSLWEILWIAGPVLVVMYFFLPETSAPAILLRRAQRLRKLTGDNRLQSQSEISQRDIKPSKVLVDALIKPLEITFKDPAVLFVNAYSSLVYGIYYSFFEVFPLVYIDIYRMNIGQLGIVFLCVIVACAAGVLTYFAYLYYYLIPDIMKNGLRAQESRLQPALFAVFGPPIGLFLFGWTANHSIHWIASVIGIVIYAASAFVVFQCIFVYVPMSYPQYAASLFAANDFFRSSLACGAIHFSQPLFNNLGVSKGVSVLAGLSTIGVIGMFMLYFYGAILRSRSTFAVS